MACIRGGNATFDAVVQLRESLRAALETTRLGMVAGIVSEVWLVLLLTRADPRYSYLRVAELPIMAALACTAAAAIGLFAFGAALNDFLDSRHDRAFSPHRAIPAGQLRPPQVLVIAICALLLALLASVMLDRAAILLALGAATGIVFFDAAAKHMPGIGLVVLGLVHAATMMIPNAELTFTLPVWLAMTHAIVVAEAARRLRQARPELTPRATVIAVSGWLVFSVVLVGGGAWRESGAAWFPASPLQVLTPVLITVIGFAALAYFKFRNTTGPAAASRLMRYGALWQSVYAAAWLIGAGLVPEAAAIAGFAAASLLMASLARGAAADAFGRIPWRG